MLLPSHYRAEPNTFCCFSTEYNKLNLAGHGSSTALARRMLTWQYFTNSVANCSRENTVISVSKHYILFMSKLHLKQRYAWYLLWNNSSHQHNSWPRELTYFSQSEIRALQLSKAIRLSCQKITQSCSYLLAVFCLFLLLITKRKKMLQRFLPAPDMFQRLLYVRFPAWWHIFKTTVTALSSTSLKAWA